MAETNRPFIPPDPTDSYERAHPEHESGMGRMDAPKVRPPRVPDRVDAPVTSKQNPEHSLNSDPGNYGKNRTAERAQGSMKDEEPLDEAPVEKMPADQRRHPRTGGKGGTPDVGEQTLEG